MLHPRPREEALLLRIAADTMVEAACVFNADAWSVFLKVTKRPRKEREEFPREVFKTSPWQKMIDSGSYKLQTTKQCRKFY